MAVFDLEAIIRLNDSGFKQGLGKAGKAIGTFAKVAGAAIAAGAAGVAALTTQAVNAYADYEQLSGGVKKLFGNAGMGLTEYAESVGKSTSQAVGSWLKLEQAQSIVLNNAEKAFETAGMSANEYIENVTGFSAALVNSYGGNTVKAAQQADKAMRAISDNFNTFGGDISSIQTAYQGFAKQNYTMLDNLKLGYGGTKTEMERLIADANTYREELGLTGDLTIDKYGDIVEAIDLIQQKQGIAGTTAKEAASTISGSLNMTKAAWRNLVRAFGDKDADLSKYFDNLVTSAETAFNNILPVAEQALTGIGQIITDLAPVIGEKLPEIISSGLPKLVSAGTGIVTALISGIAQALPALVDALPDIWNAIKDGFVEAWPSLKEAGGKLMDMLGEGMAAADAKIAEVCANFEASMKDFASRTWEGVKAKTSAVWSSITAALSGVWNNIKSTAASAWEGIKSAVSGAWDSLVSAVSWDSISAMAASAWSAVEGTVAGAWASISSAVSSAWDAVVNAPAWASIAAKGSEAWAALQGTISGAFTAIGTAISEAWEKVKGALSFKLPDITLGALPRLPKLSISGGFSIFPPSVPTISWNAKAMKNPYMFTDMTLFGAGEAGDEVLYGRTALMTDIQAGVASETDGLTQNLTAILEELRSYLPELARRPVVLDSGALVGGIGFDMDRQLGGYSDMGGRELSLA